MSSNTQPSRPTRTELTLHLAADGYMRLSREDANHFFPEDTLLAIWRDEVFFLLPTRGAAAGGLMLKQRNAEGDRSVLISEFFGFEMPTGTFTATWVEQVGGLQVNLPKVSPEPTSKASS